MSVRTLLLPSDSAARHYVDGRIDSGVRGRGEDGLRIIAGTIDTTTPTILRGAGFSVAKTDTGRVKITFDTAFSAAPSVIPGVQQDPTIALSRGVRIAAVSASETQIIRSESTTSEDGILTFVAIGT